MKNNFLINSYENRIHIKILKILNSILPPYQLTQLRTFIQQRFHTVSTKWTVTTIRKKHPEYVCQKGEISPLLERCLGPKNKTH